MKKCYFCSEEILDTTVVCPWCGRRQNERGTVSQEPFAVVVCPNGECRQEIRVRLPRGTIEVSCPKCGRSFRVSDQKKPSDTLGSDSDTDAFIAKFSTTDDLWMMLCQFVVCQQCHRKIPAGMHKCIHCHGDSLAGSDVVLGMMNAARRLVDKSALLYFSGDTEGSKQMLNEALRFNPYNAMAHNNMGGTLIKEGQYEIGIEYLERALLLDPNLQTATEYLQQGLRVLNEELSWLQCYGMGGWFIFDSRDIAAAAFETLPLELRQRLQHSIWEVGEYLNTARQAESTRLWPRWSEGLEGCKEKFVLEASGDPLSKAEIWYIVLSIRSADMRTSRLALMRMSSAEKDRLTAFLVDRPKYPATSLISTGTEQQSDGEPHHAGQIMMGPSAHWLREHMLKRHPNLWNSVYAAPTADAANGFFRRGTWQYDLAYVVDVPTASITERNAMAHRIIARLQTLLSCSSITGETKFFVSDDNIGRMNLTVHTVPIGGGKIRSIAKEMENAFHSEIGGADYERG